MNTKNCTPSERKTLKRLARKSRRQTGMSMYEAEQRMVALFAYADGRGPRPAWLSDLYPTDN